MADQLSDIRENIRHVQRTHRPITQWIREFSVKFGLYFTVSTDVPSAQSWLFRLLKPHEVAQGFDHRFRVGNDRRADVRCTTT